ncbi:MAG: ABC transporter permease [bacterium]
MRDPEIRPGIRRLFRLVARRDFRDEADDEIRLHLQLRTDQLMHRGFSPDAARQEAERLFGRLNEERTRMRNTTRRRESRLRFRDWLESVGQDVRYAVRTLRRDAGFTLFALLIISFGIGATTTMFSLVNGVLLQPLPFHDASRLVWISNTGDDGIGEWQFQVGNFVDLAARSGTLDGIEGYDASYSSLGRTTLSIGGESERLTRVPVTCHFFPFLGVTPMLGRSFAPEECVADGPRGVLLSYDLWRRDYASDHNVIGRKITINGTPVSVIGVMPESFDFGSIFAPGTKVDMYSNFLLTDQNEGRGNTLTAIGRLKPGASIAAGRTEAAAIGKQLGAQYPRRNAARPKMIPFDEHIHGSVRPALVVLACAVFAVMLIVSANLSSLQLARMSARQREMAVRLALGAANGRLIRQALTESFVLTAGGALLGLSFAYAGTRLLSRLAAFNIPLLDRVGVDGSALAFVAVLTVVTGLLIGVLPALNAPSDVRTGLREGARGSTRSAGHTRIRAALVVSEIAVACMLLVGTSLLIRSFIRLLDVELGFRPERVAALRIDPARTLPDPAASNAYYGEVLRRVRGLPGITQAAVADMLPFSGDRSWSVPGEGQVYEHGAPEAFIRVVSESYFKTMGIPMRAGRDFTDGDSPQSPPVAAVNQTLAQALWPGRDPIGQAIIQGKTRVVVVALVGDVRHSALEHAFTGELYLPIQQFNDHSQVNLIVDTDLPPSQLTSSVRNAIAPIAGELPKTQWRTLQELIDRVASPRRFVVLLLSGFAIFALVLAALGIYALVSYGVSQRTQEIGIRMALGASAKELVSNVMGRTLQLAAIGIVLGIGGSVILARSLRGLLFGVTASDPVSFLAPFLLLVVVAGAGGYFPARRASRIDPSTALREG